MKMRQYYVVRELCRDGEECDYFYGPATYDKCWNEKETLEKLNPFDRFHVLMATSVEVE